MFVAKAAERISGIRHPPRMTNDGRILTLQDADGWPLIGAGASPSAAMKLSTVDRCVNVISDSMAKMPVYVKDKHTKELIDNAFGRLMELRPNEAMAPSVYKKLMEVNRLLGGNAYALIIRSNRTAEIQELLPLPYTCVKPFHDEKGVLWYVVTLPDTGEMRKFRSWEVIHFKNFSYDGIVGVSTLQRASDVINNAKLAQAYEGKFLSQNARPAGVLEVDTHLEKNAKDTLREEWHKVYGGIDNAFRVAVLDLGMKYKQIGISNRDIQFVEGKSVSVEDIARFFGVPLYKLNAGKQSYSSNEQNSIEYVVSTMHPIVEQCEEENQHKCLFGFEIEAGARVHIDMMVELRGDIASKGSWYKIMRETGAYSANHILAQEDMQLIDDESGDEHLVSLNFVPLKGYRKRLDKTAEKAARG